MAFTIRLNVPYAKDYTLGGVTEEGFKKLQAKFGDDTEAMQEYLMTAITQWDFDEDTEEVVVAWLDQVSCVEEYGMDGLGYVQVTDEDDDTVYTMDADNYGDLGIDTPEENGIKNFLKECAEKKVKYVFCVCYEYEVGDMEAELECDEFDSGLLKLRASELDEDRCVFNNDISVNPYCLVYDGNPIWLEGDSGSSDPELEVITLDEEGKILAVKDEWGDELLKLPYEDFIGTL